MTTRRRQLLLALAAVGPGLALAQAARRSRTHRIGILLSSSLTAQKIARFLLSAIAGAGLCSGSIAQTAPGSAAPWKIGVIHLGQKQEAPVVIGLRQGLKNLGYVEGRDVVLDIRAGRGEYAAAVSATRELVKGQAHVIVSAGTVATKAAKEAAGKVPVVFTQVGEPVAAGFAKSLQRPGGNMTGFSHLLADTTGKRLEVLKELVPSSQTVLVIFDPGNPTSQKSIAIARDSAKKLGMVLRERHIKDRYEVARAIGQTDRKTADALLVIPDSLVTNSGEQIIEMSRRERMPVMFHEETWVERGGLASYGASFVDLGRRAATYVDKILKGVKPGDLPVEQPTKFDLVMNMKTAKALGITIPQSILVRADKVIE